MADAVACNPARDRKKAPVHLVDPTHKTRSPPAVLAQPVEPPVVAHPERGVGLGVVAGQLSQPSPAVQEARVLGHHFGYSIPSAVFRQPHRLGQSSHRGGVAQDPKSSLADPTE